MKVSSLKASPNIVRQNAPARWVDDIPKLPGLRLQVRLFGNEDDKRIEQDAIDALPLSKKLRGKVGKAEQDDIMVKRLHGAILVGWEGLEDDAGQPVPFDTETSLAYLSDPELTAFRDAVIWAATLAGAEAIEAEQASAKN